jgi:hypothetical protein
MRDSGRWMSLAHGWLLGCWRSRQAAKELISIRDPKKTLSFFHGQVERLSSLGLGKMLKDIPQMSSPLLIKNR